MDAFRLDLACAVRLCLRQRGPTVVAILALALGIGANSTIFSFVSGVLLRPLPYRDPDRLVTAFQDRSALGGSAREVISPGLFVDWSTRAKGIEGVSAIRGWSPNFAGRDGSGREEPERFSGASVTGDYFSALGVPPALGRVFTRDDDRPGASTTVVLSHRLWARRFASDPAIVGQTLILDGQPAQIVGVMPEWFIGALIDAELWNTMRIDPSNAPRGIVMLRTIARLESGRSIGEAQAAMDLLQTQLEREDSELTGARARLVSLHEDIVGPVKPLLEILTVSVGLVLLIACANVSSLLMARGSLRQAEMAVRVTLGATPGHLLRQLIVEGAVLAVPACALGLLLAFFGIQALVVIAPPAAARLQDARLDGPVLVFTLAIAALSAVLSGLGPAIVAHRRSTRGLGRSFAEVSGLGRFGRLVVGAEIACALVLVVVAGLFVRSLIGLQRVDLGFRPDRLLTASISPPRSAYHGDEAVGGLFDRTLARVAELPGVESAAFTSVLPLSGMDINFDFRIAGRPRKGPGQDPVASFRSVSPGYLRTMGMRIVAGRDFNPDDRDGAPMAVVVNEALVKRYWDGASPVGTQIRINGDEATIVGVAANIHHAGPAATPEGEAYVPYRQLAARGGFLVVRTSGDPASLAPALRAAMRDVDPTLPLANVRTMASLVERSVAQPRFLASVLTGFSGVAAFLALMGVYGLMSFAVSRRVREIGLRMAIGATRESITSLVIRQGLAVASTGVVAGVFASLGFAQLIRSLLFGIDPADPLTLVPLAFSILAASLVASYLPARRAARIDPVVALRED